MDDFIGCPDQFLLERPGYENRAFRDPEFDLKIMRPVEVRQELLVLPNGKQLIVSLANGRDH